MEKLGINLGNHLENTALIVVDFENSVKSLHKISYNELQEQVLKLSLFIEEEGIPNKSTIGIYGKKSYGLIALSLAVLEQSCAFSYLAKDDIQNGALDDFDVKHFFSESQLIDNGSIKLTKKLTVCDQVYYFYKTSSTKEPRVYNDAGDERNQICYTITTSGTTGRRKIVRVTYNSIAPNMASLQKVFQLDSSDIILSSAPVTFDVFIMDLFLALYSGAALKIIPNELRFDPAEATSVSFIQITPTIFIQYGLENIQKKIMHAHSRLKYLVFGGEKFPSTREVLSWQDWRDPGRKRIFNIYGVTEMSCWSLMHEVTLDDLAYGRVPLGTPLANTSLAYYLHNSEVANVEALILTTSSRVNFVDDKKWDSKLGTDGVFAYITNDLVEKIDDKMYWYGRLDDLVKRFGERVDLAKIEAIASEIISPVACILIKKRIALFYQSANNHLEELLSNHLKLKLKSAELPDDIKRIDFLPTCNHGKVSKKKLMELYKDILKEESVKQAAEDIFLEAINQIFNLNLSPPSRDQSDEPDGKRMRSDIDSTFNQIGGSSFDALRVAMKIEDKVDVSSNGQLLPKLLDNQHSIKDIFSFLRELKLKPKDIDQKVMQVASPLVTFQNLRKFNLQKCVDSSPALLRFNDKEYIAVGSHSGNFIVIDTEKCSIASEITLCDRIECEASQYKNFIIVGCYDGHLYCLDPLTDSKAQIKWKYNSGAMIKSKPLVINDKFIIFGNYNQQQNLRCIHVDEDENVTSKWSKLLGSSGIIANLLLIDDATILACTLDGTCERMNAITGSTLWTKKFEYPIFSSPVTIKNTEKILVAEVMRKVHCIDFDGNPLWSFETEGHIFSSFLLSRVDSGVKILFGSHDKKLRCLNYSCEDNDVDAKGMLEWETELQSQIYGTPKILTISDKEYVVSCSTNGRVNLLNLQSGTYENSLKLPGEVFSTPLVGRNSTVYVGCRDNFVYCLKIE